MLLTVQRRFRVTDVFRRLRRRGHEGDAIGSVELVPGSLRHYDDHAGFEVEYFVALGRSERQGYAAFQDLNDFVAIGVAFPLGGSGKSGREDTAVAVIRKPGEVARGVSLPGTAFLVGGFFRLRGFLIDRRGHMRLLSTF